MDRIRIEILTVSKVICKNINMFDGRNRGFLSQNILSQLRNFVEYTSLLAYSNGKDIEITYDNIKKANTYVSTKGNLKFLTKFHKLLQITASHYTLDEENSERLMLKYYEFLLKMKEFIKTTFDIEVLENIDQFPIRIDPNLKEYYEKITERIIQPSSSSTRNSYNDRYYIQKVKPIFVEHRVYYEVTFTIANDKSSKHERIIAFTNADLLPNYSVRLSVRNDTINILGKEMPIFIIDAWEVSIRPCEFTNLGRIMGFPYKFSENSSGYRELMRSLTVSKSNLVDFVELDDDSYELIKNQIIERAKLTVEPLIFRVLDDCRNLIKENRPGSNVIRYLLYRMNNKVLKQQYSSSTCQYLSNLNLNYKCIPFDEIPFNTSLVNHNPKIYDLFDCIDASGREHELFARYIKNNTEIKGQLYTSVKEIPNSEKVPELMNLYNQKLYYKHANRKLENYKNNIYIKGYEEDTLQIIDRLKKLSSTGIKNYSNSVISWLNSSAYQIDCDEKRAALQQMFENSRVALIYGSAGTGKSTLISHLSSFFGHMNKLYLANTNPAVDNLKRKVNAANSSFKTVAKFLSHKNIEVDYDVLIIDESSTVSNDDMLKVLNKAKFTLLVLVGDVFQIESIIFGNWFSIARSFLPTSSVFELKEPYRSKNSNLLDLWTKVRNLDEDILEHITKNNYSVSLDASIFEHFEDDEIILCLNYDGLYGINNINRFLQQSNPNPPIQWGIQTYKINDPILFNESERFAPIIYNNLKGRIVGIVVFDDKIQFDIELDRAINQLEAEGFNFELMENSENGYSVIRFYVNKYRNTDEDDDLSSEAVIPFQVAYAVSIHKAQGLEYDSVKVVITNEIEEMISHNIFYTAITRAKNRLKIYWTPETENKILTSLEKKTSVKDVALLTSKL